MNQFCLIFITVLTQTVLGQPEGYTLPEIRFEALKSGGFRSVIPDFPGTNLIAIHANINKPIKERQPGTISGESARATGNFHVIEFDRELKIGDVVNYWVFISHNPWGFRKDGLSWRVDELKDCYSGFPEINVSTSPLLNVRLQED